VESALAAEGYAVFRISALTGEGLRPLVGGALRLVEALPAPAAAAPAVSPQAAVAKRQPPQVRELGPGRYQVSGEEVERAVIMTDLENEEAVRYLHRRLSRMGVISRLRELGAKEGDRVRIGSVELAYVESRAS
jgi:GTP-binding protein